MRINTYTLSLNVADVAASAEFITTHFGFETQLAVDGVHSVAQPESDFSIVFLQRDLPSFKPASQKGREAAGLLIAFTVDDIDVQYDQLVQAGVPIVTPIETEPWGERYFQVEDPNGVVLQLVQWMTEDGQAPSWDA